MDAESSVHAEPTAGTSGPVRVPPNVVDITPDGDSGSIAAGTGKRGGRHGLAGSGLAVSTAPTIYDVARAAGVSIASVSRVLNGRRNPRPETRDRVLQAVAELGFIPDGAARALSARLKEVAGVIIRLPWAPGTPMTCSPTRKTACSSPT